MSFVLSAPAVCYYFMDMFYPNLITTITHSWYLKSYSKTILESIISSK